MSDELKQMYANAGAADRFWDTATPCALWRAQKNSDFQNRVDVLEPHPGNETRLADVKVEPRNGQSWVVGCRCLKGDFRGISTFDMKVTWYGSRTTKHYVIPANTEIPPGLAVTKDHKNKEGAYHYTIAPKDDMTLELFLQTLKVMSAKATLVL